MFLSFEFSDSFIFFFFLVFFFFSKKIFIFLNFTFLFSISFFKNISFNFKFIYSTFFFIIIFNFFGMFPSSFPFSSMIIILFFAFLTWGGLFFFLFFKNLNNNISHFLPISTPTILVFPLVCIEVLSSLARPLALSFRLMANITAGHLLILLSSSSVYFSSFIFIFILPVFFSLVFLEICVSFIQSYVFSMLIMLYTEESE